jgi:hypothetical protein
VVLTVHFCAIEHFRATFDYSYEHYKQWIAKLHRPIWNTSPAWGQCCQNKSTSHTWIICTATVRCWEQTSLLHHAMMFSLSLSLTHTHTQCSGACLVVVVTRTRGQTTSQYLHTLHFLISMHMQKAWHWHEAAGALIVIQNKTANSEPCDIIHKRYSFFKHMCIDPIHMHHKVQPPLTRLSRNIQMSPWTAKWRKLRLLHLQLWWSIYFILLVEQTYNKFVQQLQISSVFKLMAMTSKMLTITKHLMADVNNISYRITVSVQTICPPACVSDALFKQYI